MVILAIGRGGEVEKVRGKWAVIGARGLDVRWEKEGMGGGRRRRKDIVGMVV